MGRVCDIEDDRLCRTKKHTRAIITLPRLMARELNKLYLTKTPFLCDQQTHWSYSTGAVLCRGAGGTLVSREPVCCGSVLG